MMHAIPLKPLKSYDAEIKYINRVRQVRHPFAPRNVANTAVNIRYVSPCGRR